MDLVRDLLDKHVITPGGKSVGQVDGIVLEIMDASPPRVVQLLIGGTVPGERVAGPVGRVLRWMARRWGVAHGEPYQIPFANARRKDNDWVADVPLPETPGAVWEARFRRILLRIPGA